MRIYFAFLHVFFEVRLRKEVMIFSSPNIFGPQLRARPYVARPASQCDSKKGPRQR